MHVKRDYEDKRYETFTYPIIDVYMTGLRIKESCQKNGYTIKELQNYLGLACQQTIYNWFNGKSLPSIDNLFALSKLLNISLDEIIFHFEDYQFSGANIQI